MKKSAIAFAFVLSAAAAMAETTTASSANVFGVLRVDSKAAKTIVAVPWEKTDVAGGAIDVAKVVKTANLTAGDKIFVYDGREPSPTSPSESKSRYNTWILTAGEGGVLYWANSAKQVIENGEVNKAPDAAKANIARGTAFILERQYPTNSDGSAKPFYLFGQVAASKGSYTVVAGSNHYPCFNLIAAPATAGQRLNSLTWDGSKINALDSICIPSADGSFQTVLQWKDGRWKYQGFPAATIPGVAPAKTWIEYTGTIPAGTGIWYVSKGGTPTLNWTNVPSMANN